MILYDDIEEMPVFNWFKCIDGKHEYACKDHKKAKDLNKCQEAFSALYMQYIDTYGISDQLMEILDLQNQISVHKIDIALTGDRSINMHIKIKEIELAKLTEVKQTKVDTAKVVIEKYLGRRLDTKETTVKEYYDYLEVIKQENGRATD